MWWKMVVTQFCTVTKGTGRVNPIFLVLIPTLTISDFSSTGNYCNMQYIAIYCTITTHPSNKYQYILVKYCLELLLDIAIIAIPIYFPPGEAGINADSIDLFKALVKQPIPSIKPDLHYIFNLIYQNKLPQPIKRYFTDVYLILSTQGSHGYHQTSPPWNPHRHLPPHREPCRPHPLRQIRIPPSPLQLWGWHS